MMQLTILGSGTNVHPARAAAGYLVRTDQTILLDFGPRTLMNLIKTGVDRNRVTHILFSHFHADHFSDFITFFFDAMIFTKYEDGKRPPLTVIGPLGTRQLFSALFATLPDFSRAPFGVHFKEVSDRPFWIGKTKILPRTVTHSPRLHCLGYRLEYGTVPFRLTGLVPSTCTPDNAARSPGRPVSAGSSCRIFIRLQIGMT
ncbi:MAG: MBL fold metallo-hydrolase [Nitrospirae bacterium]|nr:MBL fold metallo-hydrolase [Nitrospirota bacterium]